MSEYPKVSVVVLSYNGRELITDCLRSVFAQDYPNYEVIFVDNGSDDGSLDLVRELFPKAKVDRIEKNVHFTGGMNSGVSMASGEILFLLNNDTILGPGAIEIAIDSITSRSIDICGCGVQTPIGVKGLLTDNLHETLDFAGAAIFIRKEVWDKVGGLDEDFRSYYELKDFAIRATLMGFKTMVQPEATVFHIGQATTSKYSGYFVKHTARNFPMLVLKNFSPLNVLLIYSIFAVSRSLKSIKLILGRRQRELVDIWKGYSEFVRMVPSVLRKRHEVQMKRKYPDELVFELSGKSPVRIGIDGGI